MSRIARTAVLTLTVGAALAGLTGSAVADAGAAGVAAGSPGIVSGNVIQIPIHIPINLCGNSIDIVGLLNPASGNTCVNT
ncbi:chaplin [Streptomyces sp. ISL-11]|uniref:chaplin n=1 Tax=Streptomyces sp. ISL-11 TaxID=2819174 RepID=UPI001BEAE5F4|nr:chaplin [Streptomyces sp. ISL-11]MBT2383084.1 chaplin [Streptomyces sp. ISL-11]